MNNYKSLSLRIVVMIYAALVNTHTHTQTASES